jgi:hypothetical protein
VVGWFQKCNNYLQSENFESGANNGAKNGAKSDSGNEETICEVVLDISPTEIDRPERNVSHS